MSKRGDHTTSRKACSERARRTPGGSSWLRKEVQEILKEDPRLRAKDRPNKKADAESLDDDYLVEVSLSMALRLCV